MTISKIQEYSIPLYQIRLVSLLEISPTNHIFLEAFNSEFQEIKIWFTDESSKPLEVEDRINVTLIIR